MISNDSFFRIFDWFYVINRKDTNYFSKKEYLGRKFYAD